MLTSVPPPVRRVMLRALHPSNFRWFFAAYSLAWALCVGAQLFSSLEHQLFLSQSRSGTVTSAPVWSAPLDDVFIHFDFARSTARGFPLQWSEGNGYSSGGTSLLYPFVLAVGYRIGYDGMALMLWAGIVATVSVWALFLAVERLFRHFPVPYTLLIPPVLLSVGALNWSLWSGMEVAFFLAVWAFCLLAWDKTCRATSSRAIVRYGALLGFACLMLVATRPESAFVVAAFVLSALGYSWKRLNLGQRAKLLAYGAVPGAALVGAQALANRLLTGESSAAGALVKLEAHHPYLTSSEVWDAWLFHFKYQVLRVTDYHLSEIRLQIGDLELSAGWLLWVLASVPLLFRNTRRVSALLWLSALVWLCTVSLNGQVRWQNERYTMPAVAWLLCSAALGLAALLNLGVTQLQAALKSRRPDGTQLSATQVRHRAIQGVALLGATAFVLALYWSGQVARQRDQIWFFGRASRNIYDQHVQTAQLLKTTRSQRVLVGDAGAIPYVSDLPALDIIGLGGMAGYPFARATRMGVGAAVELLERMPLERRPDVLAIYPGWWNDLPLWFGQPMFEVPVRGNVICGGPSKVVYRADWTMLGGSAKPSSLTRREQIVANVDLADLVSEKESGVTFQGAVGYVTMKALEHPKDARRDLWDAGRVIPMGGAVTFSVQPQAAHEPLQIVLRLAPAQPVTIRIAAGSHIDTMRFTASNQWLEPRVVVPAAVVRAGLPVSIEMIEGETVLYHVWGLQEP